MVRKESTGRAHLPQGKGHVLRPLAPEEKLAPRETLRGQQQTRNADLSDTDIVPLAGTETDFHAFQEPLQLFPHIPGSAHRSELYKVLIAPLGRVTTLSPL